eukprot:2333350-Alexandrium_andersonii.AAC.1
MLCGCRRTRVLSFDSGRVPAWANMLGCRLAGMLQAHAPTHIADARAWNSFYANSRSLGVAVGVK